MHFKQVRVKELLQSSGFKNRRKQKEIKNTRGARAVGMFLIITNTKKKQPQAAENWLQFDLWKGRCCTGQGSQQPARAQEMLRSPCGLGLTCAPLWKSLGLLASPKQDSGRALIPSTTLLSPSLSLSTFFSQQCNKEY